MTSATTRANSVTADSTPCLNVHIQQQQPLSLNVSFQCAPGELLALVGPSGSGKSTILRTIAGLHRATQSTIECASELWDDSATGVHLTAQRRNIGLVFQEYALFPHKSALENVLLATGGSKKARQTLARELFARTNMTGLEHRKPNTLSGGQKQRVAIARALARQPRALLLDEPFSAVDQQTRRKLYRELATLRQNLEIPIILVTHDLTEVQLLADSLCLVHHGVSLQHGAVADVISRPESREIARLLGHQNLFSATVEQVHLDYTMYRLGTLPPIEGPSLDEIKIGDNVSLLIAPSAIQIIDSAIDSDDNQPIAVIDSRQEGRCVTLRGAVQESVLLGDELLIRLHLDDVPKSLRFKMPLHEAKKRHIYQGQRLDVMIEHHGIHVMME